MDNVVVYTPEALLGIIDGQQTGLPLPINEDTATLGVPLPVTGGGSNTQIVLTATGLTTEGYDDTYTSKVDILYNRIDLATLFRGIGFIWEGKTGTSLYGILPEIANDYGINFTTDDVVDVAFPDLVLAKQINFTAKTTSVNFVGTVKLTVQRPPIELSSLKTDLAIYVEADGVSDFLYDGKSVLPFNGYRTTRDIDFTRYKTQLNNMANTTTLTVGGRADLVRIMQKEFCFAMADPLGNIRVGVTTISPTSKKITLSIPGRTDTLVFIYNPV